MIIRRGALTGITMRGTTGALVRFAVDWVRVETIITPGDTDEQTIDDAVFEVSTPATVDYEAQAIIRPTHPDADVSQIQWSTSDPSIATIDASGKVTRVSDGYIRIIATDQHGATAKSGLVHIYRQSGVESQTFVRWVEGSLAKAAADAIDSRIAEADPQTDVAIFTTQDHANGIYVRNPNCWAADLDLTGVSPWNSRSGALRAGVAISPRDVLTSEHYPLQVGNTIRFVAADNTVVTRTIEAVQNVGPANSSDGYATDFQVCTLDEDLPASIKHYSVLPAEWADYIRNLNIGLPTLGLDQEEKALVQDLYSLGTMAAHRTPSDAQRLAFYESKITGDSGNPSLLILDDEPVLVTLWTFGGAGSGPNIARLHDLINAAMTANGSPYQLTVADLSGWTNFAEPVYPPGRNMLLNTEDFAASYWSKSAGASVSPNEGIAPDGQATADLIIPTQNTSRVQRGGIELAIGEVVTASIFVKPADQDAFMFRLFSNSGDGFRVIYRFSLDDFPLDAGDGLSRTLNSEAIGNGWVRVSVTATIHATDSYTYMIYAGESNAGGQTYGPILVWGAQLEKGPLTPYEPRGAV